MKENKNIHAGHRERLRQQIALTNMSELSDRHFLEYLLTFVIPRADTNPIAHNLLNEFKTVHNIFNATETALSEVEGVGPKTANFLHFMGTTCYFYNKSRFSNYEYVGTINTAINYINAILPPSPNEQLIILILNKNYKIKSYKIFNGISHSYINFDAQELSSFLINHKASFCLIAHTHPFTSSTPSVEDFTSFKKLAPLFDSLSIKILDNLILGETGYFSANLSQSRPYTHTDTDYKKLQFLNEKLDLSNQTQFKINNF